MNRTLKSIAISLVLVFMLVPASAECLFCGEWQATGFTGGIEHKKGALAQITERQISLPGCRPLRVKLINSTFRDRKYMSEMATIAAVVAVFESRDSLKCERRMGVVAERVTVKIEIRPRGFQHGEELVISLYSGLQSESVIRSSEIIETIPAGTGKPQEITYHYSPSRLLEWWFVRRDYNPCDEGTRRGEWLCRGLHEDNEFGMDNTSTAPN